MKLTTHLDPEPRLRMSGSVTSAVIFIHGVHRDKFTYASSIVSIKMRKHTRIFIVVPLI